MEESITSKEVSEIQARKYERLAELIEEDLLTEVQVRDFIKHFRKEITALLRYKAKMIKQKIKKELEQ